MGAGKSAVGKRLAEQLGYPFFDLDHELELRRGQSISSIWATHGEHTFRNWENELFAELTLEPGPLVIATGGGTLLDPTNFDLAHRSGITIYLIVDFQTAMVRLGSAQNRPLLHDGDVMRSDEGLRQLYHHRLPFYRMADIHVDAVHGTIEEVAERICAQLPVPCNS